MKSCVEPHQIKSFQSCPYSSFFYLISGQTSDQALKKLIQKQKASGMVSEATKSPISLSTEYGKSNDALLAALLKDQGFGPTTASSIDEQVRLAVCHSPFLALFL